MPLDETFTNLAAFLNSLDAEGEQKFELSHSLVIICPDCGKNIAFRGRCPKCAGNSWIPAGNAGGIFERTKAQRLRRMIADEDVTLRGTSSTSNESQDAPAVQSAPTQQSASAAPGNTGANVSAASTGNIEGDVTQLDATESGAAGSPGDTPEGGKKRRLRRH